MKTVMAGQPISPLRKAVAALELWRLFRTKVFANPENEINYHRTGAGVFVAQTGKPVAGAHVLEIGCGQTAALTALWLADGADAWGIDVEVPTLRMGPRRFLSVIRANGVERALKSFVRHLFFDREFHVQLSRRYGKPMPPAGLQRRLRIMSATRMEFPDDSFDFVFSRNVFEHIDDVPAALAEVNRFLKPDGVAWISLHLFPSLTGGHHLEWLTGDLDVKRAVPPWDHFAQQPLPAQRLPEPAPTGRLPAPLRRPSQRRRRGAHAGIAGSADSRARARAGGERLRYR